ncbi:hypothetical protein ASPZODRAFT_12674 [Penicilliopsis zonata CBS 506.65]|uniref:Transcriptional regulatory protein RXT2 N-terminal domain-containing protein n=1 Tax=Penicilliopsis zonata CBS 506.65 TaxID=1073090 RepID=A0A1L9SR15_9EURO|nr:hypothetical protein ASPZODRAFT_12674 [Penicilliopsis zonata CBS 506.65]OJJ49543.1 hypothetical protein ASPZODRAFT_12674 [Penicilliopsis zonata CBS 506.65]
MAAQAALITDTIIGLKRALRREDDHTGSDDFISQPTNRGTKLRANAKYVREGALGYVHSEDLSKQKINHAGYTRYILQRNPPRYDSEGDELDEDDEDSEADAAAAEENPFSEIALETLLCPLKHPSELPTHPSMSQAYTSKALQTMTQNIEAKLRQERALLWRARNLHRRFLGDSVWMPCGKIETPEDRWIFEPRIIQPVSGSPMSRFEHSGSGTPYAQGTSTTRKESMQEHELLAGAPWAKSSVGATEAHLQSAAGKDVDMADASTADAEARNGETIASNNNSAMEPKPEEVDAMVTDLPQHMDTQAPVSGTHDNRADQDSHSESHEGDTEMQERDLLSPEPPRRMTTRAQTNATNMLQDNESVDHSSPSPSTATVSTLPTPHPLFLVPNQIRPDPNFGLPPTEAEETRRLLWSYIQKQEETVRGFETMLESLFRACRMKDDVLEWCKAEGHVGELSDGEDWYDREKWGLAEGEDLKKGADEDEIEAVVDEGRTTGKRGRGRK